MARCALRKSASASIPPCKTQYHQHQLISFLANILSVEIFNTVLVSPVVLEEDFPLRKETYLTFPSKTNNSTTTEAIGRFQVYIENVIKYINHICYYYSRFVHFSQLKSIPNNDTVLMTIFDTNILHCYNFDICSYCSRFFNFCHNYWVCISKGREPKFDISNKMPQLYC